jgi:hypothetical protein
MEEANALGKPCATLKVKGRKSRQKVRFIFRPWRFCLEEQLDFGCQIGNAGSIAVSNGMERSPNARIPAV